MAGVEADSRGPAVTRFSNELACPCGITGHVFWVEGGYRDCVERVVELWGEFDHRRMPGLPIGDTFEVTCRRCDRPIALGARGAGTPDQERAQWCRS
jgi:hypothetical protein